MSEQAMSSEINARKTKMKGGKDWARLAEVCVLQSLEALFPQATKTESAGNSATLETAALIWRTVAAVLRESLAVEVINSLRSDDDEGIEGGSVARRLDGWNLPDMSKSLSIDIVALCVDCNLPGFRRSRDIFDSRFAGAPVEVSNLLD